MKIPEIKSPEDNGNVKVIGSDSKSNTIILEIQPDSDSRTYHWFHFQLIGETGKKYLINIANADKSPFPPWAVSYPDKIYSAVASYDDKTWSKVNTKFDGKSLTLEISLEKDSIFIATTVPYSYARHRSFLEKLEKENVRITKIGESIQKRPISLVTIGEESKDTLKCWITACQHPGETMPAWYMQEFIETLQRKEPEVIDLLKKVTFYLIPNMNPDGVYLGNLRTNAAGMDLNRCWLSPSEEKSPEVFAVLKKMKETGVDLSLDVHSEEKEPAPFLMTGNNTISNKIGTKFIENYLKASPLIQQKYCYQFLSGKIPKELLGIAHYAISNQFNCPSLLLEMPFKEWSVDDSMTLAKLLIYPLNSVLTDLLAAKKIRLSQSTDTIYHSQKTIRTKPSNLYGCILS